ncbi:Der GTPase-activating protein YihI [Psychromonas sp. CD1]|uniref:Der GTPase-activating protein YihI n=1 Tax=Psychromonas sp. CD1 TaxID=1979839 RepID=UPI000B9A8927|nr:Der GTPase-activating protein YihI [Psychromonas sp. CD1]
MSRIKKSRTAGNSSEGYTGKRKETSSQAQDAKDRKRKSKLKGNKSGARNATLITQNTKKNAQNTLNSKRIGSKKSVSLNVKVEAEIEIKKIQKQPKVKMIKTIVENEISPKKELELLENDPRLNDLLEQLDNDETINETDQLWVEEKMARHQTLMEKLGWLDEDGEEDLIQQFEDASSALDEFK